MYNEKNSGWRMILKTFFSNRARDIVRRYLFWRDVIAGTASKNDLKRKLEKVGDAVVYKDAFHHFYLTREEASFQNADVQPVTVDAIIRDEIYLLSFALRLERLTLYEKDDLKRITKDCEIVWFRHLGFLMHLALKNGRFVYPKKYNVRSDLRYGYLTVYNERAKAGVYSVDDDELVLDIAYDDVKCIANIALVSLDGEVYEVYDLHTRRTLTTLRQNNTRIVYERFCDDIDLNVITLEDFMGFYETPRSRSDLVEMGLWGADVIAAEVPIDYDAAIKDLSGTIRWQAPANAYMFDMTEELPVAFEKREGGFVYIGIPFEKIHLSDRSVLCKPGAKAYGRSLAENFEKFLQSRCYGYGEEEQLFARIERKLFESLYREPLEYLPGSFESIMRDLVSAYDASNVRHREIVLYFAKRFGALAEAIVLIRTAFEEEAESTLRFLEIVRALGNGLYVCEYHNDDKLVNAVTRMFTALLWNDDGAFVASQIDIADALRRFYPLNYDAFGSAADEVIKSVAKLRIDVKTANGFLEFIDNLLRFDARLNDEEAEELEGIVRDAFVRYKPQNNPVFEHNELKEALMRLPRFFDAKK
jgi:hypothetical protein